MAKGRDQRANAYRLWRSGTPVSAIAVAVSCCERTILRWIKEWKKKDDDYRGESSDRPPPSLSIISGGSPFVRDLEQAIAQSPEKSRRAIREAIATRNRGKVDELAILDELIPLLLESVKELKEQIEYAPVVGSGIGSVSKSLTEAINQRYKVLKPATASDLIEQAVSLGITPSEFLEELKLQWLQQA